MSRSSPQRPIRPPWRAIPVARCRTTVTGAARAHGRAIVPQSVSFASSVPYHDQIASRLIIFGPIENATVSCHSLSPKGFSGRRNCPTGHPRLRPRRLHARPARFTRLWTIAREGSAHILTASFFLIPLALPASIPSSPQPTRVVSSRCLLAHKAEPKLLLPLERS
jgi:hypothetical protein